MCLLPSADKSLYLHDPLERLSVSWLECCPIHDQLDKADKIFKTSAAAFGFLIRAKCQRSCPLVTFHALTPHPFRGSPWSSGYPRSKRMDLPGWPCLIPGAWASHGEEQSVDLEQGDPEQSWKAGWGAPDKSLLPPFPALVDGGGPHRLLCL